MSLNSLIRLPMKSKSRTVDEYTSIIRHSLHSTRPKCPKTLHQKLQFVVEAKGKKGMMTRQFQRPGPPPLPKIEDDGNPRFVIFIRMANVCFLSLSLLLLYCNLIFHKLLYHFCYLICVYKDVNFSQLGTWIFMYRHKVHKIFKWVVEFLRDCNIFQCLHKLVFSVFYFILWFWLSWTDLGVLIRHANYLSSARKICYEPSIRKFETQFWDILHVSEFISKCIHNICEDINRSRKGIIMNIFTWFQL